MQQSVSNECDDILQTFWTLYLYVSADDICILQKKMHDMSLHPYLSALYKDETKQEDS